MLLASILLALNSAPAAAAHRSLNVQIADVLKRPLVHKEVVAIRRVCDTLKENVACEEQALHSRIGSMLRLQPSKIAAALPGIPVGDPAFSKRVVPKIERDLRRKLTPRELKKIGTMVWQTARHVDHHRAAAAQSIGRIVKLDGKSMEPLLPAYGNV